MEIVIWMIFREKNDKMIFKRKIAMKKSYKVVFQLIFDTVFNISRGYNQKFKLISWVIMIDHYQ